MAKTWVVRGDCTPGCAACCRRLVMPIPTPKYVFHTEEGVRVPLPNIIGERDRAYLATRGVTFPKPYTALVPLDPPRFGADWLASETINDRIQFGHWLGHPVVRLKTTCPELDAAGHCKLHGTPQKPDVCRKYPLPGTDLPVGCTYWFEELE